ncbi:MAG: RNA-binding cell elongation regulator Jag/EloR [Anaerolineales bacterium]|jgi:spoIIIJ-associated protein
MDETRATLEVIAPSIEEAIENGLKELGLSRNDVETEVLDEGSRGLFGLGSRQARVRLTVKAPQTTEEEPEKSEPQDKETDEESQMPETGDEAITTPLEELGEDLEDSQKILQIAKETAEELLDKMKINAEVSAYYGVADDEDSKIPLHVDINGDDLSILIGRRAETLNALQYIVSLIVGKELSRHIPLVVDVQGYRKRRERELRQLAKRVAEQVANTGRRHALEPMPANERRIVHIELRDHPDVYTESFGEQPKRKVNIIPK